MPSRNLVADGSRPCMGNLGKVKIVTSNQERTLYLCMSHILNRTNAKDIFQLNSFAGSAQSTDLYFYKQCLLLRRIPKWFMTQKTLKLIILLKYKTKRITSNAHQHRKLQAMTTKLIYMLTTLWPTKNAQSNTRRRWMLTKKSTELSMKDSKTI